MLDCLINPDWPYIPVEDEEVKESQWRKIPDLPIRYHFFYQLLDGDDEGRSPDNPDFNHKSSTCLRALCKSDHGEVGEEISFFHHVQYYPAT